jgi:Tol biopolymer transport system component
LEPKVQVISIPFDGGKPAILAEADYPEISPNSEKVSFIKGGQVWSAPINGSASAKALFYARGSNGSVRWSPDGSKLAFVSSRGDHSFIGIYTNDETPINWILPSFSRDASPRWSPDGQKLAFIRTPGSGGAPDSIFARKHQPWAIWTADIAAGTGEQIWKAPETLEGSVPSTEGGTNLNWANPERIAFVSFQDGWPHLYSIPSKGGTELLLSPGNFMVEHIKLSPDGNWLVFSANTGKDKWDLDRRHIGKVRIDKPGIEILTQGNGIESNPVFTGDQNTIAYLSSTAQRPVLPAVMNASGKSHRVLM